MRGKVLDFQKETVWRVPNYNINEYAKYLRDNKFGRML